MKNIFKFILIVAGTLFVLVVSAHSLSATDSADKPANLVAVSASPTAKVSILKEASSNIDEYSLVDNLNLYEDDNPGSIVTIYMTVLKGNSSDNTHHTWQEVNSYAKWANGRSVRNVVLGKAEAIVQFGDESGPLPGEVGFGDVLPNATIQIRGASTTAMPQKSYKIELRENAGSWRGQTTINLNKHIFDNTRIAQKLNFDLVKQIPNMVSLRTQFVHLYVKDETADHPQSTFIDYGLFTQVEQPNSRFLKNHLLDPSGQLYKATSFEFYRYPDQIRMIDDPLYDEDVFSLRLEIKGNEDHSKLIQMLNDVNNYDISIEGTFEKYFDEENYFTWMAYNILVGNVDTQNQNYFLYSPRNSTKWYFIPWDYDNAMPLRSWKLTPNALLEKWESGVSNYWGGVLHNRVLRVESFRQDLDQEVNELMLFLTPDRIKELLDVYKPVTDSYVLRMPDLQYLPSSVDVYHKVYELFPGDVQENYELYLQSLKSPMPFYLGTPKINEDVLMFNWDEAYDFNAQNITYDFQVAKDWDFRNIVYQTTLTNIISTETEMPEPGIYYWRVIATNESGFSQDPFDHYIDGESDLHSGMKYLEITQDGQILEQE